MPQPKPQQPNLNSNFTKPKSGFICVPIRPCAFLAMFILAAVLATSVVAHLTLAHPGSKNTVALLFAGLGLLLLPALAVAAYRRNQRIYARIGGALAVVYAAAAFMFVYKGVAMILRQLSGPGVNTTHVDIALTVLIGFCYVALVKYAVVLDVESKEAMECREGQDDEARV